MLSATALRALLESARTVVLADWPRAPEYGAKLMELNAAELIQLDGLARSSYDARSEWGSPARWLTAMRERPDPLTPVLASMHPDGHVRQAAAEQLTTRFEPLADQALALRATDWVAVIAQRARFELGQRTSAQQAARIAPILHRLGSRSRADGIRQEYVYRVAEQLGPQVAWATLRDSQDPELRLFAWRTSDALGLITLENALECLPGESMPQVRRAAIDVIVGSATPLQIMIHLLRGRWSEGRVAALARLSADDVDPRDLLALLTDRASLVRWWARRRWQEQGNDPTATYRGIAASDAPPTVRACAHLGLIETGHALERDEAWQLIDGGEARLRRVGMRALVRVATPEDAKRLVAMLADSPPLPRLASDALMARPELWLLADLDKLAADEDPRRRQLAWRTCRSRGQWDRLVGSLRLAADDDEALAARGRTDTVAWLNEASRVFEAPTASHLIRIREHVADAGLDTASLRTLEFMIEN